MHPGSVPVSQQLTALGRLHRQTVSYSQATTGSPVPVTRSLAKMIPTLRRGLASAPVRSRQSRA